MGRAGPPHAMRRPRTRVLPEPTTVHMLHVGMPQFSDLPFGSSIRHLLDEAGLSLRALSRELDLDVGHVSRLRAGLVPAPPDGTLERIAATLKVQPDYFLEYRVRRVAEDLQRDPLFATSLYLLYRLPAHRSRPLINRMREVMAGVTSPHE